MSNENKRYLKIDSAKNYSKLVGCNVFDIKRTHTNKITLKCTNGDGVLIGSMEKKKDKDLNYNLNTLNPVTTEYINEMFNNLKKSDIDAILILEPIYNNKYIYNLDNIQNLFSNIKILDLTNYNIEGKYWFDNGHLNNIGKELYSQHLINLYLKEKF